MFLSETQICTTYDHQNMESARSGNTTLERIQERSTATVEVVRKVAFEFSDHYGITDIHCSSNEVVADSDIKALCLDLAKMHVHDAPRGTVRKIPKLKATKKEKKAAKGNGKGKGKKVEEKPGIEDILVKGWRSLKEKGAFASWKRRTMSGDAYAEDDTEEPGETLNTGSLFDNPEGGQIEVDVREDPEFVEECGFTDATQVPPPLDIDVGSDEEV